MIGLTLPSLLGELLSRLEAELLIKNVLRMRSPVNLSTVSKDEHKKSKYTQAACLWKLQAAWSPSASTQARNIHEYTHATLHMERAGARPQAARSLARRLP